MRESAVLVASRLALATPGYSVDIFTCLSPYPPFALSPTVLRPWTPSTLGLLTTACLRLCSTITAIHCLVARPYGAYFCHRGSI
ncbi:hypothetical protein POJ06DRAFT_56752 [Lipomyces tetrasporus]|uniref:Uncharacterized protein n=1 Tax=Lipomyces tetrasporus TaxID=54092 RepID=A0AAD7VUT6_9ASCO|nr:uncharacterized protein POJ06DRAFT_56752 [Lipomyces tetrasporus]KAJ8102833.1 hypothetical protein POJ06DRAFT_56752 [Lipomyces tetrasporus]